MYVFLNSFVSGVNTAQSEITFSSMGHIKIYNDLPTEVPVLLPKPADSNTIAMVSNARNIRYTEGIKNSTPIIEALNTFKEVTGVTQQVNENVFLRNGVTKYSANLSGVDVENEDHLFKTSQYMVEGNYFDLEKRSDGIILGSRLAQNLGVGMQWHSLLLLSPLWMDGGATLVKALYHRTLVRLAMVTRMHVL